MSFASGASQEIFQSLMGKGIVLELKEIGRESVFPCGSGVVCHLVPYSLCPLRAATVRLYSKE